MPLVGPVPGFHELPVLVDFHASIALPEARPVMAAVHGLVARLQDTGAKADEVPPAVVDLVAQVWLHRAPGRPDARGDRVQRDAAVRHTPAMIPADLAPQLVANDGIRAMQRAIAEPEAHVIEPKVDGVRGLKPDIRTHIPYP